MHASVAPGAGRQGVTEARAAVGPVGTVTLNRGQGNQDTEECKLSVHQALNKY